MKGIAIGHTDLHRAYVVANEHGVTWFTDEDKDEAFDRANGYYVDQGGTLLAVTLECKVTGVDVLFTPEEED